MAGWVLVHRWTGLACTAFLLMLCVTGLPLIFHAEIDDRVSPPAPLPAVAAGTRPLPLDALLARALAMRAGDVPLYMSFDEDRPVVNVTSAPTPDAAVTAMHFQSLDRRTGRILPPRATGMTDWLLRLHSDMLLGLGGELFLGAMGLVFAAALVSGVVLYVPFMARLAFGTVRHRRGSWVRRLDRHNLFGAVTLAWAAVVALTGTLNTLATPITQWWQATELARFAGSDAAAVAPLATSVDAAVARTGAAAPGTRLQFIAFPGAPYAGRRHLGLYLQGATPLTKKLLTPAFVDARSGRLDAVGAMPWYMQALLLAQPLHFGDYAGLPMKFLWAGLDVMTIVMLWTGLRLWRVKRGADHLHHRPDRPSAMIGSDERRLPIRKTAAATLTVPLMLASAVMAGLAISLAGDGIADALGWLTLASPVVVLFVASARTRLRR